MTGDHLAAAAQDLVGTPFKLGGRTPPHGLDCLGVLCAAMAACGRAIRLPSGYGLHVARPEEWLPDPASLGLIPASGPVAAGDVFLVKPGPAQAHLMIAGLHGDFIHAHAGLRRVVASPGWPGGLVLGQWRLAPSAT